MHGLNIAESRAMEKRRYSLFLSTFCLFELFFCSFTLAPRIFFPLQQQTSTIIFMMRSRGERKQTNNDKAFEMFKRLNKRKREKKAGKRKENEIEEREIA